MTTVLKQLFMPRDPSADTFSKQLSYISDGEVAVHANTGSLKFADRFLHNP